MAAYAESGPSHEKRLEDTGLRIMAPESRHMARRLGRVHARKRRVTSHAFSEQAVRQGQPYIISAIHIWCAALGDDDDGPSEKKESDWSTPTDMRRLALGDDSNGRRDIIHYLQRAKDPDTGEGYSVMELMGESALLLGAGSETANTSLASIFYFLVHNPDVLEKLKNSIRTSFSFVEEISSGQVLTSNALGPRGCLGRNVALFELYLAIVRVLFLYDVRLAPAMEHLGVGPSGEYKIKDYFIIGKEGPVVQFRPVIPLTKILTISLPNMKLVIVGATGFVGGEVLRQALRNPAVTSIVAITRREMPEPPPQNFKLNYFVLEDWTSQYPESLQTVIRGADACIWSLAITPSQSRNMDFAHVTTVCYDYTIHALKSMAALANKPFRFIYVSGILIERDQTKELPYLAEYRHMRGRTENALLEFANQTAPSNSVQVTVTKPGAIDSPGPKATPDAVVKALFNIFGHTPRVHVSELAAAVIDQCQHGITKDPLWSDELAEIGKRVLKEEDYLR
ncbi:uncharacterized protein TRUGW13939_11818 [Talaromyces rugulosus]|uniref:NAD(P)-binding domain-containing protein n=1 Tax=Talaromyces rugulosus TaxID=121627 RepID=A0A7H8RDS7_TALRU|nr:uncharacterized protein TRUGW13939_11818 [Talaromyces rugulosus]QKX64642.1 hypothetical protein TRUGW13939_11818 [Talaromyces rugulosus]